MDHTFKEGKHNGENEESSHYKWGVDVKSN